jgi:hypothetical protein
VVPNRGAVRWCQGCRQSIQFLDLYTYLDIQGCRQISTKLSKGAANQKRVGNTAQDKLLSPHLQDKFFFKLPNFSKHLMKNFSQQWSETSTNLKVFFICMAFCLLLGLMSSFIYELLYVGIGFGIAGWISFFLK